MLVEKKIEASQRRIIKLVKESSIHNIAGLEILSDEESDNLGLSLPADKIIGEFEER